MSDDAFSFVVISAVAVAIVVGFCTALFLWGVYLVDQPRCYERAEAMGAPNVRWGIRAGCLVADDPEGPYVPIENVRFLPPAEGRG